MICATGSTPVPAVSPHPIVSVVSRLCPVAGSSCRRHPATLTDTSAIRQISSRSDRAGTRGPAHATRDDLLRRIRDTPIVNVDRAPALRFRGLGGLLDDSDFHTKSLLGCAGELLRQRNDRRFVTPLVTCRRIHVAKRHVRRCDAAPRTNGDEGAVATRVPWTEPIELFLRALAERFPPVVDMAGRHVFLPGESGARVEGAVRADRVRVLHVHMTWSVVDAVGCVEAVTPDFVAQERHLVVE